MIQERQDWAVSYESLPSMYEQMCLKLSITRMYDALIALGLCLSVEMLSISCLCR